MLVLGGSGPRAWQAEAGPLVNTIVTHGSVYLACVSYPSRWGLWTTNQTLNFL